MPSGQGFIAADLACKCSYLFLVINLEIPVLKCVFKVIYDILPKFVPLAESLVIEVLVLIIDPYDVITGNLGPVHHDYRVRLIPLCQIYSGLDLKVQSLVMFGRRFPEPSKPVRYFIFTKGFCMNNKLISRRSADQFNGEKNPDFLCKTSQELIASGKPISLVEGFEVHHIQINDNRAVICSMFITALQPT